MSGKSLLGALAARAPEAVSGEVPEDACGPARGWLAHLVPGDFNCAASWIFFLPPPLSHKASPFG